MKKLLLFISFLFLFRTDFAFGVSKNIIAPTGAIFLKSWDNIRLQTQQAGIFSDRFKIDNDGTITAQNSINSSGIISTSSGVVGAPSHTFGSSLNTGMWSPAAGQLAFSTNGGQRILILSNGYIGFGSSVTPTANIGLNGNGPTTIQMERNVNANTAGKDFNIKAGGATIVATDKIGGNLVLSSGISTGTGASNINLQTATPGLAGTTDNNPNTKMTILGNGNVGIGVTAPASTLEVSGSMSYKYLAVTGATTLDATHRYVSASGAGTYAITLPTAVSITGRIYIIKSNMDTGISLTVNTTSSQTIDGDTSITLSRYSSVQVISNGANWEKY